MQVNQLDLPLHLFQVLEEEHISLYGQLEEETVIYLRGRQVTSRLDWDFHQGHIKNWVRFKSYLLNPPANLPAKLERLLAGETPDWQNEAAAQLYLNELLEKYIYDAHQFRHANLGKTTEKLLELYPKDLSQISAEELKRVNRLLLEDLFPEHLERVGDIRLAAAFQRRHERQPAALCLSGGGIRSGTFGLGLLQGLARHNLLKQFHYLSTVSGGGYIGAWLTAWIHRHPQPDRGLEGVTKDLTGATPGKKIDPEPEALRHLREYSNFLTPQAGLLSADTWTFLAIYVRNLLINWSVIIPLLLGFLLIPRLNVAIVLADPPYRLLKLSLLPLGALFAALAIAYIALSRPALRPRLIEKMPWFKDRMGQRGFLIYCLLPLVLSGSAFTTYWSWTPENYHKAWLFPVFGAVITALAWVISIPFFGNRKEILVGGSMLILTGIFGGLLGWAATRIIGNNLTALNIDENWATEFYVCYAVPLFLFLFMLAATFFAGVSSHLLGIVSDEDREWWARFSAWTLISAGAWVVFSTLVLFGPIALLQFPKLVGALGGISGILALVLGQSAKTPATQEKVAQGGWRAQLSSYLLPLLAILFLAVFVAALSLFTSRLTPSFTNRVDSVIAWLSPTRKLSVNRQPLDLPLAPQMIRSARQAGLPFEISNTKIGELVLVGNTLPADQRQASDADLQHMRAIHFPRWWFFLVFMSLLVAVGFLLARVINLNLFSLHNSYRNRLIRGFLAASRPRQLRRPNPFTGFDTADNVSMHELRPALLHEVDFKDIDGFTNQLKMGGESCKKRPAPDGQPSVNNQPQTASEFLYTHLSDKGRAAVEGYEPPAPLSQSQRVDLIEDLNRILEADEIQLGSKPGFVLPLTPGAGQQQTAAPPPAQRREYHIHRNRQALEHTYPQFIVTSDYPPHRLLHVVNTTLNLVGGDNLAWQQRKAESFTVSPLHCGSYRVGYRRSKDYGGDDGISLGTAMAISGAAASSNMGYYTTSPVLSLLLTLFNVRLGWWLGNPGPAGSRSYVGLETDDRPGEASRKIYRRMSPIFSVMPVFYEAFGMTDDRNDYVYLTDGGHFENLGLYEMVLRRCNLIVVSDAAADAKYEFNDLANAVRKVRIDLGIHIEFPDVPIYRKAPDKEGQGGCYWSIGLIRYSDIDYRPDGTKARDGILIYIKPAVYDDEPEDVVHYKRTHPAFPNETTADQFFDEPQFESYRALGSYIMDKMCGSHSGELDLQQLVSEATRNFYRLAPQVKDKYKDFWASRAPAPVADPAHQEPAG